MLYSITKRLRWAVIGVPASGKTYLLSDLVQALAEMGYEQDELPLTVPYSSLGTFFFETGNIDSDGIQQTPVYACRQENHYGGIFKHKKSAKKVEVEFLNIPGEVFQNAESVDLYNDLKTIIQGIKKGHLQLSCYANPTGEKRYILEPEGKLSREAAEEEFAGDRKEQFFSWRYIYKELEANRFADAKLLPKSVKRISGKYLLDHFFEIMPDSVFATLHDIWNKLGTSISFQELTAKKIFQYFYFLYYTEKSTEIILCDKLFGPKEQMDETHDSEYNFSTLIDQICTFVDKITSSSPNIHLAFRGADYFVKHKEKKYQELLSSLDQKEGFRNKVYSVFLGALLQTILKAEIDNQYVSEIANDNLGCYINSTPPDAYVLSNTGIDRHIRIRLGNSLGSGFWKLLNKTERKGTIEKIKRKLNGKKTINQLLNDSRNFKMPPHVYFTGTPIDIDFQVYSNRKNNASLFEHFGTDKYELFHIETATNGTSSFCFGSYQLLEDILKSLRLYTPEEEKLGELLKYIMQQ